jgi:hypothetical protein
MRPVSVTYAGIFKSTNGSSAAFGFAGQTSPAQIAFTDGTLVNGVLSSALGGAGQLTIPLVPGTSAFGSADTASPLGPVSGTSYLSTDGTFFYANLTPVNAPNQREFVAGGLPVGANALAATGDPDRRLHRPTRCGAAIEHPVHPATIRRQSGERLRVAALSRRTGECRDRRRECGKPHPAIEPRHQRGQSAAVLVTSIGSVNTLQSSGQPVISGVVRALAAVADSSTRSHRLGLLFQRRRQRQQPLRRNCDLGLCADQTK